MDWILCNVTADILYLLHVCSVGDLMVVSVAADTAECHVAHLTHVHRFPLATTGRTLACRRTLNTLTFATINAHTQIWPPTFSSSTAIVRFGTWPRRGVRLEKPSRY